MIRFARPSSLCATYLLTAAALGGGSAGNLSAQGTPEPTPAAILETVAASPAPPGPAAPRPSYSSCRVEGPVLALTFDDGPSPTLTPKLLDLLKENGIKATFFLVGENAAQYPELVRRIAAEGHEIGNHTWTHLWLTKSSESKRRDEITRSSALIEKLTGHAPRLLRPPYGATSTRLDWQIREEFGLQVVLWSVDPLDWKYRDPARIQRVILAEAHAGSIVLSHDIHATTIAAMPGVFAGLREQGYRFVTVSELIALDRPAALPAASAASPTAAGAENAATH